MSDGPSGRPLKKTASRFAPLRRRRPVARAWAVTSLICLSACASGPRPQGPDDLALRSERELVRVSTGSGGPVASARLAIGETFVFDGLHTAAGDNVLRPPKGARSDHPEQLPLMVSHGDVGGVDFWSHPTDGGGGVVTEHSVRFVEGGRAVELAATLEWRVPELTRQARPVGELLLLESRRAVLRSAGPLRTLDIDLRFSATGSPITIADIKEGLLALRLDRRFERFVDGSGARAFSDRREETPAAPLWGERSRWMCCAAPSASGEGVDLVAVLDHPDNIGHPTRWHIRPYGLLAANPFGVSSFTPGDSGQRGALTLGAYESARLRYRIVVTSGPAIDLELVDALWRAYAGRPPQPAGEES